MNNTVDLLQIKIERAREQLPTDTLNAIAGVDWKTAIMRIREKKGYNFEQLGALEIETELLLCGLISPNEYPKEIQNRMNISKAEADELVNEMNMMVFKKIREELVKNTERKRIFEQKKQEQKIVEIEKIPIVPTKIETPSSGDVIVLKSAGIEMVRPEIAPPEKTAETRENLLQKIEHPSPLGSSVVEPMRGEAKTPVMSNINSMLQQKIIGSVQVPIKKTEHTLENIPNTNIPAVKAPEVVDTSSSLKKDPYRMSPDE